MGLRVTLPAPRAPPYEPRPIEPSSKSYRKDSMPQTKPFLPSSEAAGARPGLTDDLMASIKARSARVGIVGLGYVGLPLAESFAAGGYTVLGFDIDVAKVEKLRKGESYIG